MHRHRVLGAVGLFLAATLVSGCSESITTQSLADAAVGGAAPTSIRAEISPSSASTFADMFMVDITWDEVPKAEGYELQKVDSDNGYQTIAAGEDQILFGTASATQPVIGYDIMEIYRVRAVFEGGAEVSEWSKTTYVKTDPGNVLYEVEGSAGTALITMRTSSGTEQASIKLPLTSTSGSRGVWIQGQQMNPYISAQATSPGTITCRITVMGQVVSENTSSGFASIATCSP